MPKITNKKTKGNHELHHGTFKLQTMTALIKSFCGGPGGSFYKKRPLAAGGKNGQNITCSWWWGAEDDAVDPGADSQVFSRSDVGQDG